MNVLRFALPFVRRTPKINPMIFYNLKIPFRFLCSRGVSRSVGKYVCMFFFSALIPIIIMESRLIGIRS